jgi:hypothetical protein
LKDAYLVLLIEGFIQQVRLLGPTALERLMEVFADIEGEAERRSRERVIELRSMPGDDEGDPSADAEDAMDAGVAHLQELNALRQSILNLLPAGLSHLFEQQRAEYMRIANERGVEAVRLRTLPPKIVELDLVANTVKHAEGNASAGLRDIRPDLFGQSLWMFDDRVTAPLAGEGLYVKEDDIRVYAEAVIALWREVATEHSA